MIGSGRALDVLGSNKRDPLRIGLNFLARLGLAGPVAAGPARPAWTIPRGDFGSLLAASAKALAGAARRNLAAEQDRWFPWCIVAFGSGITIYFGLSTEPAPWMALATAVVSATIAAAGLRAAGMGVRFACAIIAAAGLGFAAAKLRTDTVSAPIIARDMGPLGIEGRIESVSDRVNGARIVLRPSRLGRDNAQDLPRRLRLSVRYAKGAPGLVPGEWVSLVALLHPPPAPAIPHGSVPPVNVAA